MTQFDYLHIRSLVHDLAVVLGRVARPGDRILDLYCGSRPYDDLLPPTAEVVGFDVEGNPYGVADVVSDEFLPFPDASFDLVMCIQAFDFVADPGRAVAELQRVLRPGGAIVVTVPLVWEYDRETKVHRYSGPGLEALFEGWQDVEIVESGGRAVAWATLTGSLAHAAAHRFEGRAVSRALQPLFAAVFALVNGIGALLDLGERRYALGPNALPMNLMLVARSPSGDPPGRGAASTPRSL